MKQVFADATIPIFTGLFFSLLKVAKLLRQKVIEPLQ
jgi:hypothetical protein